MRYDVIIIGGGQAGSMVAIMLRQQKYSGSILLINDENHLPYQRPPLSKKFLTHSIPTESLYFKSSDYYENNNIDILLNNSVTAIKRNNKEIEMKSGAEFHYEKLVIANGSKLNRLDFDRNKEGIYYLKNINDSEKIKSLLDFRQKIAIIGAGYIGLEIAAAAIKKDHEVTVFEADQRVMSRSVCQETSNFFEAIHQREGVNFLFNAEIKNIQERENKKIISLNDDKRINADAIIIGIGVRPKTDLAIAAGLNCKDGITVNEFCQTSDENIFAIGDCANYPNTIFDLRLRLESVQNAIDHAKIVASKINEIETPDQEIPWFWSDQYNIKLKIAGISKGYDAYVLRGNISEEKFSIFYLKKGRIIALETINDNKSFSLGKKLIKNQVNTSEKALADSKLDPRELLP